MRTLTVPVSNTLSRSVNMPTHRVSTHYSQDAGHDKNVEKTRQSEQQQLVPKVKVPAGLWPCPNLEGKCMPSLARQVNKHRSLVGEVTRQASWHGSRDCRMNGYLHGIMEKVGHAM
jgi:hypothetical protein